MKKFYYLCLLVVLGFSSKAQIINIPDPYLKAKLLAASPSNQIASNVTNGYAIPTTFVTIDTNGNGQVEQSEALQIKYLSVGSGFGSLITNLTGIEAFTNLEYLGFGATQVTSFSMPSLVNLISLRCPNSSLTSLDLTGLNALKILYCPNNQLTQVNLTSVPNLITFYCPDNLFTVLDFSNLSQLTGYTVSNNLLETVDNSHNQMLLIMYVSNNPNLTSINIKNGSQQELINTTTSDYLDCWATGCPNLTTICADDNEVAAVQAMLNSCAPGNTITVDSSCDMANEDFANNSNIINLYPNPTNATVNINSNGKFNIKSVTLYDMMGHAIYQPILNNNLGITSFDMTAIAKGVYVVKIDTNKGSASEKIVKE